MRKSDRSIKVPDYELKRYKTVVENDKLLREQT
jgi:hypothetical protein